MKQKEKKANSIYNNLCRRVCELKMADIKKKTPYGLFVYFKKKKEIAKCHDNLCKTVHTHGMTSIVQYQQWPQRILDNGIHQNICCIQEDHGKTEGTLKTARFILSLSLCH